jgi:hypothetical protein
MSAPVGEPPAIERAIEMDERPGEHLQNTCDTGIASARTSARGLLSRPGY